MTTSDAVIIASSPQHVPSTATRCVALAAVILSCSLPYFRRYFQWDCNDGLIGLVALVTVLVIENCDLPGLGLRRIPLFGWWHWCRLALWFGFWIGVVLVLCVAAVWLLGLKVPVYRTPPSQLAASFFLMCVYAPLVEEVIYRSLLCVAFETTFGSTGTIVISGFIFALLHILRGNASPENQIAGFLLTWAFLRSGTILVPLAMHSAGNFVALMNQIAVWYWIPENVL